MDSESFRQRISRLRANLDQIGLKDHIIQTRHLDETAYYFDENLPFMVLYRVDDVVANEYINLHSIIEGYLSSKKDPVTGVSQPFCDNKATFTKGRGLYEKLECIICSPRLDIKEGKRKCIQLPT